MNARPSAGAAPNPRSTFVTLTAWFGIATAGCATPMALVQSLMGGALSAQVQAVLDTEGLAQLPFAIRYALEHVEVLSHVLLAASVMTLVVSIGLLKRMEWGRLGVMALLVVAILQQLGLFWLQLTMGDAMGAAGEAPRELGAAMLLLQVVGGFLTVLQVGVCAWMIWKLQTPQIRAEFGA